jgi:hypothetical protein
MPPDIPAAKLRPTAPKIMAFPPVMYSQPWSPNAIHPNHGNNKVRFNSKITNIDRAVGAMLSSRLAWQYRLDRY